nr:hypothetical protein Iba_chr05bCG5700 [Ipomoea batatas]
MGGTSSKGERSEALRLCVRQPVLENLKSFWVALDCHAPPLYNACCSRASAVRDLFSTRQRVRHVQRPKKCSVGSSWVV